MHPQFLKVINSKFKFSLFLLKNLPSAYFSGVRVVQATAEECSVTVPYKWFSRNPFGSTYFACLAMAAEMSTGVLALGNIYKRQPKVSMLVVNLQAEYYKKATGITTFVCADGQLFATTIATCIAQLTSQTVTATAIGYNATKEVVAKFVITWSFKAKA